MPNHLSYIQFFERIHFLSPEAKEFLREKVQFKSFQKGQIIVEKGQVMEELLLVKSGMIRSYLNFNEVEISTWVNWEGELVTSVSSFFDQSPSLKSLDCVEDTIVESIRYKDFKEMIQLFPELQKVHNIIVEKQLAFFEIRVFMSRIPNSRERYNYFVDYYPKDYIDRIPKKVLASLLAIRPETLSRIIAENSRKQ